MWKKRKSKKVVKKLKYINLQQNESAKFSIFLNVNLCFTKETKREKCKSKVIHSQKTNVLLIR